MLSFLWLRLVLLNYAGWIDGGKEGQVVQIGAYAICLVKSSWEFKVGSASVENLCDTQDGGMGLVMDSEARMEWTTPAHSSH